MGDEGQGKCILSSGGSGGGFVECSVGEGELAEAGCAKRAGRESLGGVESGCPRDRLGAGGHAQNRPGAPALLFRLVQHPNT